GDGGGVRLGGGLVSQAQLKGRVAMRHMAAGRFGQFIERQAIPQSIAGIGWQAVAVSPQETVQWLPQGFASGVPQCDIERCNGIVQQAAGANPITHARQTLPRGLDFQDMHADKVRTELTRRLGHGRYQSLSERYNIAMPLHPSAGSDPR